MRILRLISYEGDEKVIVDNLRRRWVRGKVETPAVTYEELVIVVKEDHRLLMEKINAPIGDTL